MSSSDKDLVSKGLHFAISPKQIDYSNVTTEFELLHRSTLGLSMTTEEKDRFKTKLKDMALPSFKLFSDNCKFENNLSAEETNSFKALMGNKDIVIQKVDKGNRVVITDKDKYIEVSRPGVVYGILKSKNRLLTICRDFNQFCLL